MMTAHRDAYLDRSPTRKQALWFWFRSSCLRIAHIWCDSLRRPRRYAQITAGAAKFTKTIGESSSALYSGEGVTATERSWQLGKVENLRIALRGIDGIVIPAGGTFSFWRQVGPPWKLRGFVVGRELRQGCIIPNVGGGLCQLSNALYDCALKAGCEIVERHRHTSVVPGSLAQVNRDATVFWNYVDLRFRALQPLRISGKLTSDRLEVTFHAANDAGDLSHPAPQETSVTNSVAENCATCGIESCLRHAGSGAALEETVVLVDEFWPEFDNWLSALDRNNWHLRVPMRNSTWRRSNYAWTDSDWNSVRDVPLLALLRAWRSRRLATHGAARQRFLLAEDRRLAKAFARHLPWQCSRMIVSQSLLPHLHSVGRLGGRSCNVLLTRLPMRILQERLDTAAARHPESPTLSDFRCDPSLADAEWAALEQAESLITCHAQLATIWPNKTTLLPWQLPPRRTVKRYAKTEPLIVFPASGVARKGAIELRDALRQLDLPLRVVGVQQLEGDKGFWHGVRLRDAAPDWLEGASAVVLPAWVEHCPRRLLEAISAGIPVIASDSCGLHSWPDEACVTIIPCGEPEQLAHAVEEAITGRNVCT